MKLAEIVLSICHLGWVLHHGAVGRQPRRPPLDRAGGPKLQPAPRLMGGPAGGRQPQRPSLGRAGGPKLQPASRPMGGPAGGSRQPRRAGGREEAENLKPFFP